jgi:hypothetical protein
MVIDMAISKWFAGWTDRESAALYLKYSRQKGLEKSELATTFAAFGAAKGRF